MKAYACYPSPRSRYYSPRHAFFAAPYRYTAMQPAVKSTSPVANILKSEAGYQIQLAIPGVPKENVKVEINDDQLIISATNSNQDSNNQFVRNEFDYSSFKRSFRLPKNADSANLNAKFENGILTIDIPFKHPETIKIDIQ